jgi:putative transposase
LSIIEVKRVSKYDIKRYHSLFGYCDSTSFGSKNLYNLANYYLRQCFMFKGKDNPTEEQISILNDINLAITGFNSKTSFNFHDKNPAKISDAAKRIEEFKITNDLTVDKNAEELKKLEDSFEKLKRSEYIPQLEISKDSGLLSYEFLDYYFGSHVNTEDNPYKLLPIASSQQVLRSLLKDWKSFFASIKEYGKNPQKFSGRPKLPKYKNKNGRHKISFTNQSCKVKNGLLIFPETKLTLKIGVIPENCKLKEVRLVPMGSIYKIEVVWDKTFEIDENSLDYGRYAGIDLGLKNFATITNNIGIKPIIVNGKPLVSMNQYYNKEKARLQKQLPFVTVECCEKNTGIILEKKVQRSYSNRIATLTRKRNNKIDDFMHKAARYVIRYCLEHKIGNLVVGKNAGWKDSINIGKKNNQMFVGVPFNRFIDMLTYKAEEQGIKVSLINEDYTSKSSFLDLDHLPVYEKGVSHTFSGLRIKRGLYRTGNIVINADVNGSYNILRRFNGELFNKENIANLKHIPMRVNALEYTLKKTKKQPA